MSIFFLQFPISQVDNLKKKRGNSKIKKIYQSGVDKRSGMWYNFKALPKREECCFKYIQVSLPVSEVGQNPEGGVLNG